jgi:hypothetical protein
VQALAVFLDFILLRKSKCERQVDAAARGNLEDQSEWLSKSKVVDGSVTGDGVEAGGIKKPPPTSQHMDENSLQRRNATGTEKRLAPSPKREDVLDVLRRFYKVSFFNKITQTILIFEGLLLFAMSYAHNHHKPVCFLSASKHQGLFNCHHSGDEPVSPGRLGGLSCFTLCPTQLCIAWPFREHTPVSHSSR